MKIFLSILLLLTCSGLFAQPTADAGSNQTIYLSSTSTATLSGSGTGSGLSYQWTEVSTDYMSGATITTPTAATTTVTGLPQGTFYFELAVTDNVDRVAVDTVVVRVNYSAAPDNYSLLRSISSKFSVMVPIVNSRTDTTNTLDQSTYPVTFTDGTGGIYYDRSRTNGERIDSKLGKFYSTVEDGYKWGSNSYARSELHYGSGYAVDTTKTYCFEWKGYYPQSMSFMTTNTRATAIMQIHGNSDYGDDGDSPPFQFIVENGKVKFLESNGDGGAGMNGANVTLAVLDAPINETHTIKLIVREGKGYAGQDAFVQVIVDGVQKYYRNTGQVGVTLMHDYIKFATNYDWGKALVDPANHTRNRKVSLTTEEFNIYSVGDATNTPPSVDAGPDQVIYLPSTTLSGTVTPMDGHAATYLWTKVSGSGTLTDETTLTPSITGLTGGTSIYRLTATQDDDQAVSDEVQIYYRERKQYFPHHGRIILKQ